MVSNSTPTAPGDRIRRWVLVCLNRACRKAGAAQVLTALRCDGDSKAEIVAADCLGQCGNGPMILVLPDEVWYAHLCPWDAAAIADLHLTQPEFGPT